MKNKILVVLFLFGVFLNAQDNLRLSEIANTPLFFNPAQQLTHKSFDLFHTSRWVGFTGAPGTTLFSIQLNTEESKVSYGGMFLDDVIGAQSQTEMSAFYSYTLNASDKIRVSLGISGGIRTIKLDNSLLNVYNINDPVFKGNINTVLPNMGIGMSMFYQDWFLSLSSPSIFTSVFTYQNDYDIVYKRRLNTYFNIGKKNISLKKIDSLTMTSSLLVAKTSGAPTAILLKNDWIYKEKLVLGTNLNFRSSIGFSLSYTLNGMYKILYGFDYATTDLTFGLPNSSQYFMLSLQL